MDFSQLGLRPDMVAILDEVFQESKKHNPYMTKRLFLETIIGEWLDLYIYNGTRKPLQRDNVVLKNRLKEVFKIREKTQTEVAKIVGVNRSYLGQVVRGNCEPSVTLALLIMEALNYPPQRFNEVFYLEPVEQE